MVLSDKFIGSNLDLKKFGKKVIFKPHPSKETPHIRFKTFDCNTNNYCNFAFEYPIEGVTGSGGAWIKKDGSVKLEKTSVYEN